MKRVLLWCGLVVTVVVAVVTVAVSRHQPAPARATAAEPIPVHFSDLAPAVYRHGTYRGQVVRIAYPLRLHPTSDQLIWEFRPGSDQLPPTHRVHFVEQPPAGLLVVVGTVEGIAPDGLIRLNNVPGVVVISAARVVPRESP